MKRPAEELDTICAYCEHATVLADSGACVCLKHGVVRTDGHCRRFRMDLLKIRPHLPLLPNLTDTTEYADP